MIQQELLGRQLTKKDTGQNEGMSASETSSLSDDDSSTEGSEKWESDVRQAKADVNREQAPSEERVARDLLTLERALENTIGVEADLNGVVKTAVKSTFIYVIHLYREKEDLLKVGGTVYNIFRRECNHYTDNRVMANASKEIWDKYLRALWKEAVATKMVKRIFNGRKSNMYSAIKGKMDALITMCINKNAYMPSLESLRDMTKVPKVYFVFYNFFLRAAVMNEDGWKDALRDKTRQFAPSQAEARALSVLFDHYFSWIYEAQLRLDEQNKNGTRIVTDYDFFKTDSPIEECKPLCDVVLGNDVEIGFDKVSGKCDVYYKDEAMEENNSIYKKLQQERLTQQKNLAVQAIKEDKIRRGQLRALGHYLRKEKPDKKEKEERLNRMQAHTKYEDVSKEGEEEPSFKKLKVKRGFTARDAVFYSSEVKRVQQDKKPRKGHRLSVKRRWDGCYRQLVKRMKGNDEEDDDFGGVTLDVDALLAQV